MAFWSPICFPKPHKKPSKLTTPFPSGGPAMADSDPFGRSGGSGTAGHASRPTGPLDHHRHPRGVNWNLPLLLGRATVRRLLGSAPPAAAAVVQLEERHHGWGYSRPVVALDVVWNSAFVLVSVAVLLSTWKERPATPIRAWVFGYVLQSLLHVGFVCFEYRRRRRLRERRRSRWIEVEEDEDEESRFVRISMFLFLFSISIIHPTVVFLGWN